MNRIRCLSKCVRGPPTRGIETTGVVSWNNITQLDLLWSTALLSSSWTDGSWIFKNKLSWSNLAHCLITLATWEFVMHIRSRLKVHQQLSTHRGQLGSNARNCQPAFFNNCPPTCTGVSNELNVLHRWQSKSFRVLVFKLYSVLQNRVTSRNILGVCTGTWLICILTRKLLFGNSLHQTI